MQNRKFILGLLISALLGAVIFALLQVFIAFRIDHIKASRQGDPQYVAARAALYRDYPAYIKLFNRNIFSMKIEGKRLRCYFFYKKSSIIYEDDDFMYCYNKISGEFLGRV